MLAKAVMVIIWQCVYQINTLYTLHLQNFICPLYLNKAGAKELIKILNFNTIFIVLKNTGALALISELLNQRLPRCL